MNGTSTDATFIDIGLGLITVFFLVTLCVNLCALFTFVIDRISIYSSRGRITCWIFWATLLALSHHIGAYIVTSPSFWESDTSSCSLMVSFCSSTYLISNIFMYLVFYERSLIASKAEDGRCFVIFRYIILGFTLFLFIAVLLTYVHSKGIVLDGVDVCVTDLPTMLPIGFLCADTSLSAGYLGLFIIPLRKSRNNIMRLQSTKFGAGNKKSSSRQSKENSYTVSFYSSFRRRPSKNQDALRKLTRKNLRFSIVAMTSTFVCMSYISALNVMLPHPRSSEFNSSHHVFKIVANYSASSDLFVNCLVLMQISVAWVPNRIKRFTRRQKAKKKHETISKTAVHDMSLFHSTTVVSAFPILDD